MFRLDLRALFCISCCLLSIDVSVLKSRLHFLSEPGMVLNSNSPVSILSSNRHGLCCGGVSNDVTDTPIFTVDSIPEVTKQKLIVMPKQYQRQDLELSTYLIGHNSFVAYCSPKLMLSICSYSVKY